MSFDFKKALHYFFNCKKVSDIETYLRREKLKNFTIQDFKNKNRCEILATVVQYGIDLVKDSQKPSQTLVADLKAVLIGKNMTVLRDSGAYFAGNIIGSEGFKK